MVILFSLAVNHRIGVAHLRRCVCLCASQLLRDIEDQGFWICSIPEVQAREIQQGGRSICLGADRLQLASFIDGDPLEENTDRLEENTDGEEETRGDGHVTFKCPCYIKDASGVSVLKTEVESMKIAGTRAVFEFVRTRWGFNDYTEFRLIMNGTIMTMDKPLTAFQQAKEYHVQL